MIGTYSYSYLRIHKLLNNKNNSLLHQMPELKSSQYNFSMIFMSFERTKIPTVSNLKAKLLLFFLSKNFEAFIKIITRLNTNIYVRNVRF